MSEQSSNFLADWYTDKVDKWLEGPRLDFKKTWANALENEEKQFKLAKLIIAFGNIAFRTGKPAYILYGVDDATREIVGLNIKTEFPCETPKWISESEVSIKKIVEDGVRNPINLCLDDWIDPEVPDLEFEYGFVRAKSQVEKFVAYIQITSGYSKEPFHLSRSMFYRGRKYKKGSVFIRLGSSSVQVDPDEVDRLYNYRNAPYFSKSQWLNIIDKHKSSEFLDAYNFVPYLEPKAEEPIDLLIDILIKDFLNSNQKVIFISGTAGSGKSLFLRRFTYQIAAKHSIDTFSRDNYGEIEKKVEEENYVVKDISADLEVVPTHLIPLFFSLRTDFDDISQFDAYLRAKLNEIINIPSDVHSLFNIPGTKWLLLLDGFDELSHVEEMGSKLVAWLQRLPINVKVLITTRSDVYIDPSSPTITISPVDFEDIPWLIRKKLLNPRVLNEYAIPNEWVDQSLRWLFTQSNGLFPLLTNHRAIDAFVQYISNSPQYQATIDLDRVPLHEKRHYKIRNIRSSRKIAQLPIIEELETDKSDYSEENPNLNNESIAAIPNVEPLTLELGPLLRFISNVLRKENVKRKPSGFPAIEIDDRAHRWLEKFAWYSDWSKPIFNQESNQEHNPIDAKSLEWNTNLGFIKKINYREYSYISHLYQLYCAAEYSSMLGTIKIKTEYLNEIIGLVKTLYSELMESEGKQPVDWQLS